MVSGSPGWISGYNTHVVHLFGRVISGTKPSLRVKVQLFGPNSLLTP